jgi:hypothetical protein
MSKHFKWAKLWFLSLGLCVISAYAAEKEGSKAAVTFNGSFEGGYALDWKSTPSAHDDNWLVDYINIGTNVDLSDSTKLVFLNSFSVGTGRGLQFQADGLAPQSVNGAVQTNNVGAYNTRNYYSGATILANRLAISNLGAYLDQKLLDGFHVQVGHVRNIFGMESMTDRFNMPTYYFSNTYSLTTYGGGIFNSGANGSNSPGTSGLNAYGWEYDTGVKLIASDPFPGTLEVAVLDGSGGNNNPPLSPAVTARYAYAIKTGDMSFTPVISGYFGKWYGGPKDLGLSAGVNMKMGMLFANVEFLSASSYQDVGLDSNQKSWSIYAEPGVDMGMFALSLKGEFNTQGQASNSAVSDFNIGAAISHTYSNTYRIRIAYEHTGLAGNIGNHVNDIRLLVGTQF